VPVCSCVASSGSRWSSPRVAHTGPGRLNLHPLLLIQTCIHCSCRGIASMNRPSTSLPQLPRHRASTSPSRPYTSASPSTSSPPPSSSKPHTALSICPPDVYPSTSPVIDPSHILAPFSHMPATARSASLAAMCHVVQGASAIAQSPGNLAAMYAAIHSRCAELLQCAHVHLFIAHGESRGKATLHTLCANGHATTITAYGKRAGLLGATAVDLIHSASSCDPLASFSALVQRVDAPEDHPLFDDSVDIIPPSGCDSCS
jgi:hypothetical protein